MASSIRSMARASFPSLSSCFSRATKAAARSPLPSSAARSASRSSPHRFRAFSRSASELGCCSGSLFPLHTAVAAARLTSRLSVTTRSCRALSQGIIFCRAHPGP